MTPEGTVKARGRKLCQELEIYTFPVQQSGTSRAGIPDDILCVNGVFVSIEYKYNCLWGPASKRLTSLPTLRQAMEMEAIREAGGVPLVVDKVCFNMLEPLLRRLLTLNLPESMWEAACASGLAWQWKWQQYKDYRDGKANISFPVPCGMPVYAGVLK